MFSETLKYNIDWDKNTTMAQLLMMLIFTWFVGKTSVPYTLTPIELEPPTSEYNHESVMAWKHFPQYWPFTREIHRSPMDFPYKMPVMPAFDLFLLFEQAIEQTFEWTEIETP